MNISQKTFLSHFRRCLIYLLNIFINNWFSLSLIGLLNRKLKLINTVFVAYPATEEYALAYFYPKHKYKMRWKPWPVGIFKQNGFWGLITVISSTERDFVSTNKESLNRLYENTERIKEKIGADQITFAGVLPGVLFKNQISDSMIEANVTVSAVSKALLQLEFNRDYENIIILGSHGYIGSNLILKLKDQRAASFNKGTIHLIDVHNKEDFPLELNGSTTILINLTRKSALMEYRKFFWNELTILNEVYPAPSKREIKELSKSCGEIYHIVGIVGSSYPAFPKEYKGGIPCCAGWNAEDLEVILKRLN